MKDISIQATRFHGYQDAELIYQKRRVGETRETKRFIIQERDVSYRFFLHQHPFVGRLMQKLLRKGVPRLQAADTEYAPDNAALPGSIEVALKAPTILPVPVGARVALVEDVTAALPGGGQIALSATMQPKLAAATSATLPAGASATLVGGMTHTPDPGTVFALLQNSAATLFSDTEGTLAASASIFLPDGSQATLAAGTKVVVLGGVQTTIPAGAQATLLRRKWLPKELYAEVFTATRYNPSALVQRPYPVKDLDFSSSGAYAVYNWELFFHVPITIAIHLSKNGRFAEAQRWFHFLFDPTDDSDGPTPERFWKVRPFQYNDVKKIEEILVNLATGGDEELRNETIHSIEAWKDAPFRPHVIARYRQQAYMYNTVMAYLDNLIAWGDSLFRQDTGEAIDEALMLYVLAANILGPRPQPVPKKGAERPQTYHNLRGDLNQFGTVMRDVEADIPFDLTPFPPEDTGDNDRLATVRGLGKALYFGVPRNDKLLSYWDTVADRLFKIRNSLNFAGVFRQLALFEPPIDPAMLARAAAAGLDVGAIINGLNQPLPLVRFQLLAQKAAEIAQEVKTLGNSLLSAMEKEDNEALAILRAKHERAALEMAEQVKYGQLQEAIKAKEGLIQSLALAVQRYTYYEQQLGKSQEDITRSIPELGELDKDSLQKMKLTAQERGVPVRQIEVDIAQDLNASGGKIISSHESQEMAKLKEGRDRQDSAAGRDKIAGLLAIIPTFGAHVQPFGPGGSISFGGSNLAAAMSLSSSFDKTDAEKKTYEAGNTAKVGTYSRREQDWAYQSNLAAGEITQIFKQLRAAQIREAVAELELKNHRQQIKHAAEIEHFLNEEGTEKSGKKTNKALYTWMKREVRGLYGQCFQLAFDTARKAERALQHELGNPSLSYLQFGYLGGKEGLLAGEKLYLDIKRMELAYQELNQREYELTKHVSLLQVDPLALIQLRATGRCTVRIPEELFDMDGPGHYFRRIKSVALSIPCVTGPYASVSCTLTLLKSSVRKTPVMGDGYARADAEDARFDDYFGSTQSVVTSSAQNDSGLFEANLRDERYLPFEYAGAISEWQLELPANPSQTDPAQFDYATISDVVLHLRYTARAGGGLLRNGAVANLKAQIDEATLVGCVRLFSVRHEFPTEWARFQRQVPAAGQRHELALTLRSEHYPFWGQERLKQVKRVDILARSMQDPAPASLDVFDQIDDQPGQAKKDSLVKNAALGDLLVGKLTEIALPASPMGAFKLYFGDKTLEDLWFAVTWGG
jgi:Tc toxin complex TcA C-terminal TcB-binding domain